MKPREWAVSLVEWFEERVTDGFHHWADREDDGVVRYVKADGRGRLRVLDHWESLKEGQWA